MKSSKMYPLSVLVAVFIVISFPSINSVFKNIMAGEVVAQSAKPFSIAIDKKAPSKPSDLEISLSKNFVVLKWDASSDNTGVTGYKIYRGTSEKNLSLYSLATLPTYIDSSFVPLKKYYYKVSAHDAAGNESGFSKTQSIKTPEIVPVVPPPKSDPKPMGDVPPAPYSVLARAVSTSSLNLIWKHDYNYPVTPASWKVYRNGALVSDIPYSDTYFGVGIESYFYRETGLTPNTVYVYEVKEVSLGGVLSATSTPLTVKTLSVPDVQTPSVSISSPSQGAVLSATTTVLVTASDNVGIAGVQLMLDGVTLGQEMTSAPYVYAWNTRTTSNGAHTLRALARDTAGNTATSSLVSITVSNTALDPAKKPWQNFNLNTWRIQATAKPTAPTDYYLITIRDTEAADINQWFRTDPNDGSMLMWLDATKTNDGTWYRTELREVMGQTNTSLNWSALTGTSTLSATMRVAPSPTYNAANVTLLQIHPLSGDPLMRLAWYTVPALNRQLKVHYKTDADGLINASVFCPNTNIGFNPFDVKVSVIHGRLLVQVGPVGGTLLTCLDYQINPGWTRENYFKIGNYASQSYAGTGQVNIYKLETYHSEPGI